MRYLIVLQDFHQKKTDAVSIPTVTSFISSNNLNPPWVAHP
jgi:hypothetical protein